MIEPRCLIRGHGSTGSFPGDFAELGKWFRQPGSQTRHEAASRDRETPRADNDPHCCTNEKRTSVLRPCCVEWFVALCNPLISLVWPCNVSQHGIDGENEAETRKSLQFQRHTMVSVERIELPIFGLQSHCSLSETGELEQLTRCLSRDR